MSLLVPHSVNISHLISILQLILHKMSESFYLKDLHLIPVGEEIAAVLQQHLPSSFGKNWERTICIIQISIILKK